MMCVCPNVSASSSSVCGLWATIFLQLFSSIILSRLSHTVLWGQLWRVKSQRNGGMEFPLAFYLLSICRHDKRLRCVCGLQLVDCVLQICGVKVAPTIITEIR